MGLIWGCPHWNKGGAMSNDAAPIKTFDDVVALARQPRRKPPPAPLQANEAPAPEPTPPAPPAKAVTATGAGVAVPVIETPKSAPPAKAVTAPKPPGWILSVQGSPVIKWKDYPVNVAVRLVLSQPPWAGMIWRDLFHVRDMLVDCPITEVDCIDIAEWIGRVYEKQVVTSRVSEAIRSIAREHQKDELVDYLKGLEWDGTSRLVSMLHDGFGVRPKDEKKERLVAQIGRRWMIQAVRRALEPGCKADSTLIVYSPNQGPGKSSAFAALFGHKWFSDSGIPIGQDDVRASMQLRAAWGHELGEASDVLRPGIEALKQFLTRQTERYVPKYGTNVVEEPRRCVFCGTTNDPRFLKDPTGARRFWPVEATDHPDLHWIRQNRDQLWAEAMHEYKQVLPRSEEEHWIDPWDTPERRYWFSVHDRSDKELLDSLADQHEEFEQEDSWTQPIKEYLTGKVDGVTTHEILTGAINKSVATVERKDAMRVGDILRSLGYIRVREASGNRSYVYKKPPEPEPPEPDRETSQ